MNHPGFPREGPTTIVHAAARRAAATYRCHVGEIITDDRITTVTMISGNGTWHCRMSFDTHMVTTMYCPDDLRHSLAGVCDNLNRME